MAGLDGTQFSQFIACPPKHVWDYLLVFAYRVVEGPATTEDEYRVLAQSEGARFETKGRVLLDSGLIRLTARMMRLAEDSVARREVKRLEQLLEDGCG